MNRQKPGNTPLKLLAAGDYEIVITVKDAAGNENTFRFTLVVTEQELAG